MTVSEIQSVVASYLQKTVAKFDIQGTDVNLVLLAMNNARKYAEKRHNWNVCRQKGYFSVNSLNKVLLDSPTWFDGGTEKMKEGKHWWLRGSANVADETVAEDRVMKVIDQGVKYRLESDQEYGGVWWDERNERQDRTNTVHHPLLMQPYAVSRGKWLELYPKPEETKIVVVDGYKWWPNWNGPSDGALTRRTWKFRESDITISGGPAKVLFRLYKTAVSSTEESVAWVMADPMDVAGTQALVDISENQATCFTETSALSAIVEAVNKFVRDGSVWTDSGDIFVMKEGEAPMLTINTFDGTGAGLSSFSPTVFSDVSLNEEESDWWTENAEEFLILRSMVEANRLSQAFVGNKEGNLPPPVKEAEAALELLIRQDEDMKMAGGAIELY